MYKLIRNHLLLLPGTILAAGFGSGPSDQQKPLTSRTCLAPLPASASDPRANFPDCTRDPLCSIDVCDESLSPNQRAQSLVAELTIWEKLDNLVNEAPGVSRLGIPPYEWWSEGLHGVASSPGTKFAESGNFSYATSFPQPIVIGSAFDDELVEAIGAVVSKEARAFSNDGRSGLDLYSPNINAFKDPRWGRGQETPGEDPFHLQNYVAAMLTGLEGSFDPSNKNLIATCKHYAANDFEHYNGVDRAGFNAIITTQDLSEYYLPPFKTCAVEKNVGSFMCSYNGINGTPLCANAYLLEDILRGHWRWNGEGQYVSTDCDCVALMVSYHHYAPDLGHAAAWSMKAGTDLECNAFPGSEALQLAWNQSLISEEEVDRSLTRMYTALISVGQFDSAREQPLRSLLWRDVDTEEARELAYRAAVEGSVLLKNDGILPLSADSGKKFALVGPWAKATTQMQGNYYGPAPYLISPYQAARDLGLDFTYTLGSEINASDDSLFDALKSAKEADVVIFAGGVDNTLEAETLDRKTLAWPEPQLELLRALAEIGKPVIVLQFGGGQVDDTELLASDSVSAILWGGYPGQSGGKAIFDLLFGREAPSGRLSVTQYPAIYNEAVPSTDMNLRPVPGNSGLGRTYMWYLGETPVPYGFGLHYTTFDVELKALQEPVITTTKQLILSEDSEDASRVPSWQKTLERSMLTVAVTVTNAGKVTSDYVALLFLTSDAGPEPRPLKTLAGYTRFRSIQPGQAAVKEVVITVERLVRVDVLGNRVLHPGSYEVFVDLDKKAVHKFHVGGPAVVVEKFPQPKA
ncbi:glycosyl hydrolase family 3 N terminal domain-containing protein [Colletotrichum paranaense]|uniref:xylan 1,4-beta-xylosidase n=1 Tax=Colletotrichum paranaense TaxID=1914294 RepID=A0ABQ9SLX8_9PEZI|nr:glycosyl hydrolase family 3 N terminal domain-containing protein [Colletotrichum paranaense]KAK1540395.1 glycosyl hydrolase family 3 N terminal domain-containing protein [Colletotrichum paranaense]